MPLLMASAICKHSYDLLLDGLIHARKSMGLRQTELAKRLGKPQSFVSKIENGERGLDVIEFIIVARAIGVDPIGLFKALEDGVPKGTQL